MNSEMIVPLLIAGILAGLVNFFVNDINLPFGKTVSLTDGAQISLKDIWWVALIGYVIVGCVGSFLTPLVNALVDPLKGLDWLNKTKSTATTSYQTMVLVGYGLVFGYSTVKLLVGILDIVNKKINNLEAKVAKIQPLGSSSLLLHRLSSDAGDIIDECEIQFDQFKSDCSGFVKAVANALSINLTGQADDIVKAIQEDDWVQLGKDGVAAKNKADAGWFVIGGLLSIKNVPPQDHGHVVVVVSGPLAQDKYPTAYWGKLGGVGEKNKTINWAWNVASRDNVIYSAKKLPVSGN